MGDRYQHTFRVEAVIRVKSRCEGPGVDLTLLEQYAFADVTDRWSRYDVVVTHTGTVCIDPSNEGDGEDNDRG
jgi:hypothetical protein